MANNEIQEDVPAIPTLYDNGKTYVVVQNVGRADYHNAVTKMKPGEAILIEEQMGSNMISGNHGIIALREDADVDALKTKHRLHTAFKLPKAKAEEVESDTEGEEAGKPGRRYGGRQ